MSVPLPFLTDLQRVTAGSHTSGSRGSSLSSVTGGLPAKLSSRALFRTLRWLLDVAAVIGAWEISARLAHIAASVSSGAPSESDSTAIPPPVAAIGLWVISGSLRRLNAKRLCVHPPIRLSGPSDAVIAMTGLTLAGGLFTWQVGRGAPWTFLAVFPFLLLGALTASRRLAARLKLNPVPDSRSSERVAIVGQRSEALELWQHLRKSDEANVVGLILPHLASDGGRQRARAFLGVLAELGSLVNKYELDRLILIEHHLPRRLVRHCQSVAARMGLTVSRMLSPPAAGSLSLGEYHGVHVVDFDPPASSTVGETARRVLDRFLAGFLLVLLSPLLVALATLVKITSPGPVLYRSRRVGKGGRHFTLYKFRSMHNGGSGRAPVAQQNEQNGHLFKIRRDPRVTLLGGVLRRYSLDELPQLFNVLIGEMSLVGPRPLPAEDLEPDGSSHKHADWARERARVLPGITGLWQVRGRSDLPFEEMVEYDLRYVRDRSWGLDFHILLKTPMAVLSGCGAY